MNSDSGVRKELDTIKYQIVSTHHLNDFSVVNKNPHESMTRNWNSPGRGRKAGRVDCTAAGGSFPSRS